MDLAGFLSLFHQLYPAVPVSLIILVAAIAVVLGWFVFGRKGGKREGQRLDISASIRSGPDTPKQEPEEPLLHPQSAVPSVPSISVKAEANPTISPHFHVPVTILPPQYAPAPLHPGQGNSAVPATSETGSEQGSSPISPSENGETRETERGNAQPSSGTVGAPGRSEAGELPHIEMHQLAAPNALDVPHQEPIEIPYPVPPLNDTTDTQTNSETVANSTNSRSDKEQPPIDETDVPEQPPIVPARATPSGRLASQVQRSDAQTALRMMSLISQRTYAYVRANRRNSVAQKPFANELLSIRLLHEYVEYVRPHLNRLNQSLNHLGIGLDDPTSDPRWVLSAFLDPFSGVDIERSPTAMREAVVETAQSLAEAIKTKGFPYRAERKWGPNGALFYSLDDRGAPFSSIDEADFTDFDINEADVDMDDGAEESEP